ncbi:hypothetical protein DWV00_12180 [Trinickia dinghuensis]|uniref:Uncharacterized protein n=2 Tax=Trinickia dinghuensis TaxID=2291023 RepID=A0A3D8K168_9BURK|nr:hypothetical protein DWV00_12180 [Trinickia dinghuensis]
MRAHSLQAIGRLQALWMNAGAPAAARAVLDSDGASLLAVAEPDARPDIRMRLAQYRLQIAYNLREDEAIQRGIAEMREVIDKEPTLRANEYLRLHTFETIERVLPAHAVDVIELRHALHCAVRERAAFRAWDEAERQRRRALAYKRLEANADAIAAANASFDALQNAAADQTIDTNSWLQLSNFLIAIAPDRLPDIERAITRLTADLTRPKRREMGVRVARLAARAVYAREGASAALAASDLAHHALSEDGGDDFIEYELPWLIEAGRIDDAGQRAFFDLYERESQLWQGTARIIHDRLAESSDTSAWWALCVMLACRQDAVLNRLIALGRANQWKLQARSPVHGELFAKLDELRGTELREAIYTAACALAEQRAPGHPWIARLSVEHDARVNLIDSETEAARLADAIERGGINDNRSLYTLLTARCKAVGLLEALKLPAPQPTNGRGCYFHAFTLQTEQDALVADVPFESRSEAIAGLERLKTAFYEQGVAHAEHFLETGEGHPYDGSAHLYSLLCWGLAICYTEAKRFPEAIELHRRGLDASPFCEHYAWMIEAHQGMKDYDAVIETGEHLWHFSMKRGFGNESPNIYISQIVKALWQLDRDDEILIWLERLVQWQRKTAEVDESKLPDDALYARMVVAANLANMRPTEATALWEGLKGQVTATGDVTVVANAGTMFDRLGRFDEAQAMYERVLGMNEQRPEHERFDPTYYEEQIASCRERAAQQAQSATARKPWWRFWQ